MSPIKKTYYSRENFSVTIGEIAQMIEQVFYKGFSVQILVKEGFYLIARNESRTGFELPC